MKKFLISVLICFLLICSFGCGENAVSRKIEELQTKIDGQTEAIAELKDQNQRLAEQNKDITTRLTEIEWGYEAPYGSTLDLVVDYEFWAERVKYITKQDLMSFAYYLNGGREGNEAVMGEDFIPTPLETDELTEDLDRRIKETKAFQDRYSDDPSKRAAKWDDYRIEKFGGRYIRNEYERSFNILLIKENSQEDSTEKEDVYIDGVVFRCPVGAAIILYIEGTD